MSGVPRHDAFGVVSRYVLDPGLEFHRGGLDAATPGVADARGPRYVGPGVLECLEVYGLNWPCGSVLGGLRQRGNRQQNGKKSGQFHSASSPLLSQYGSTLMFGHLLGRGFRHAQTTVEIDNAWVRVLRVKQGSSPEVARAPASRLGRRVSYGRPSKRRRRGNSHKAGDVAWLPAATRTPRRILPITLSNTCWWN